MQQKGGRRKDSQPPTRAGSGIIHYTFTSPHDLRSTTTVSIPTLSSDYRRLRHQQVTVNTPRVGGHSEPVAPGVGVLQDTSSAWELDADALFDDVDMEDVEVAADTQGDTAPRAPRYFSAVRLYNDLTGPAAAELPFRIILYSSSSPSYLIYSGSVCGWKRRPSTIPRVYAATPLKMSYINAPAVITATATVNRASSAIIKQCPSTVFRYVTCLHIPSLRSTQPK
jgi:hypothetical protein